MKFNTPKTEEEKEEIRKAKALRKEKEKQDEEQEKLLEKKRERVYKEMIEYQNKHRLEPKVAPEDSFISLQHINKIYGNRVQAVFDFNLEIKEHEFIVFVGPSGCGKSTTLRMIAGLEAITSGDLYIDKVYSNDLEPKDRNLSMVFQNYALYPHMSVYNNMAFGLKMRKVPKEEIDEKVHRVAKILQLEEYLDRKPKALSGGQCQRVALGRAIVRDTKLFLMDEPLSNLDAKLRVQMRSEIVNLHETLGSTTIYVTHDQTEAMTMATRIVVMNKGRIQQVGTPKEVYNHPSNIFVATFIGSPAMNILKATYDHGKLILQNGFEIELTKKHQKAHDDFYAQEISRLKQQKEDLLGKDQSVLSEEEKILDSQEINSIDKQLSIIDTYLKEGKHQIIFGVRPENITENGMSTNATNLSKPLKVEVMTAELLGQEYFIHTMVKDERLIAKLSAVRDINNHEEIEIVFDLDKVHLFDVNTEKYIA